MSGIAQLIYIVALLVWIAVGQNVAEDWLHRKFPVTRKWF